MRKTLKRLLGFGGLLLLGSGMCLAQYTTVTATVVDSDSTVWANAPYTWSFQPGYNQSNPANYSYNGAALNSTYLSGSGAANGSGVISITTYQNTLLSPIPSSYNLTVCPLASTTCATINFSTSSGSVDVSSQVNAAITAPRFHPVSGSYGYNDGETIGQLVAGSTYWNVTSNSQECYSIPAATWGSCGGGGGGSIGGSVDSGYMPIAVSANTLGNGPIDYGVTTPDALTIQNAGAGGTHITDSGGGGVTIFDDQAGGGPGVKIKGSHGVTLMTSNDYDGSVTDSPIHVISGEGLTLYNDPTADPTSGITLQNGGTSGTHIVDMGGGGILIDPVGGATLSPGNVVIGGLLVPGTIYSAAGTALPSCVSGINGARATVSDATLPTFLGTYASGGAVVSPVMCNGTTWVTY